jgi:hypothetical protein
MIAALRAAEAECSGGQKFLFPQLSRLPRGALSLSKDHYWGAWAFEIKLPKILLTL